jgi:hypothetical protein
MQNKARAKNPPTTAQTTATKAVTAELPTRSKRWFTRLESQIVGRPMINRLNPKPASSSPTRVALAPSDCAYQGSTGVIKPIPSAVKAAPPARMILCDLVIPDTAFHLKTPGEGKCWKQAPSCQTGALENLIGHPVPMDQVHAGCPVGIHGRL